MNIVDYGTSHQVCKLEVPALMPTNAKISSDSENKQRMYAFLTDLLPPSMRGLKLGELLESMSAISLRSTQYEYVTISELQDVNKPYDGKISVTFKNDNCPKPASQ